MAELESVVSLNSIYLFFFFLKIAEKYLQNFEPFHKNESRVQMSFNHEKISVEN